MIDSDVAERGDTIGCLRLMLMVAAVHTGVGLIALVHWSVVHVRIIIH